MLNLVKAGYLKAVESGAQACLRLRLSPNAITILALCIGALASLLFLLTKRPFLFIFLMLLGAFMDALDGRVARLSGTATKFGGYLDAMCDRFFESMVVMAAAHVTGHWALCFLFMINSYAVGYAKARTALEVPISNDSWPDLMGREGRSVSFAFSLAIWGLFPNVLWGGQTLFSWALIGINIAILVTLRQRLIYARHCILSYEKSLKGAR